MLGHLIYAGWALILVLVLIPLLRKPAEVLGLVDEPGGRKEHDGAIPLTGGIAVVSVFVLLWFLRADLIESAWPLGLVMIALMVIGAIDDWAHVRPSVRLAAQVLVAIVAALVGGVAISHLGEMPGFGKVELGLLSVPFTILCLAGLMNAINMADGVDGLAAGMAVVMLGWLAALALLLGLVEGTAGPLILIGGLIGFLYWNFRGFGRRPAVVFLGDAGSTTLGLVLGWFAIDLAMKQTVGVPPLVFAWILAYPVIDTVVVIIRRIYHGNHPLRADREHLHHHLLRLGMERRKVTLTLVGASFSGGLIGVGGWWLGLPEWALLMAFIVVGLLHLVLMEGVLARRPKLETVVSRRD